MATVATLTRTIIIPNFSAFGSAEDSAIPNLLAGINAQTVTVGPTVEVSRDNQWIIVTVAWPAASDAAFVAGASMAAAATSLGLAMLGTWQVTSTSAY